MPETPSFTIGIEEEYQIIDPQTRELKSYITEMLEAGKMSLREQVKAELHQSIVEVGTKVCRTSAEAREELVRLRRGVMDLASRNGLKIAAAGTRLYTAQTHYSGGASFDGNNTDIAYLSIESGGIWEIQEWRTADNGATWAKQTDITSGNTSTFKRARVYSPDHHEGKIAAAYWSAAYASYTSWTNATIKRYQNETARKSLPPIFFKSNPMMPHLAM